MPAVDELEGLPTFDYGDPSMRGPRFHEAMRELGGEGWLARGLYGYIVLDREAGEHFLRSRSATFPGMKLAEIFGVTEGPLYEEMRRNILHINGPDHTRLRSLVNPSLSPRAVERHRPAMRALLERLFDEVIAAAPEGEAVCELVGEIAKPYPSQVIAHVMGVPLEDAPRLHHWSNWIQRQFDAASMMEQRPEIERAVQEFYDYARPLLAARRQEPGDDLISTLLAAEAEGERLDEEECLNLVLNVLIGGVDTTQSQLAHAIRLFAEHPHQWELLAGDVSLAPAAVEEALRFEPVTPFTARIVEEEMSFRDVTFPAGTIVMVCAFTGNRDLEGAGGAERFDITAERPRARNLTFGAGVHYCLGANLARAELEEALAFLAPRMRDLRLTAEPQYESITGIYGLASLPVAFRPAAPRGRPPSE